MKIESIQRDIRDGKGDEIYVSSSPTVEGQPVVEVTNYDKLVDMLQTLTEIQHQKHANKANVNNSKHFEWNPHIGLNRRARRQ